MRQIILPKIKRDERELCLKSRQIQRDFTKKNRDERKRERDYMGDRGREMWEGGSEGEIGGGGYRARPHWLNRRARASHF